MSSVALLLLQAATAVAPQAPAPDDRLLHPVQPPAHCDRSSADIVVCARDQDSYRLHGAGPQIEPTVPTKAEWRLFGNAKMGVAGVERKAPGGGGSAPAVMATVTVPF